MTEQRPNDLRLFYIWLRVVVFSWLLYWIVMMIIPSPWQTLGLYGDMFGSLNALFSGLAFAGLIYTILLQREDIETQKIATAKQNDQINAQRFEGTFFNLFDRHTKRIEGCRIAHPSLHRADTSLALLNK